MRHRRKGRELSRTSQQRKALLKTLLGSLIMGEKITTTEARAKEAKSQIDPIISQVKRAKEKGKKMALARNLSKILPKIAANKLAGEFANRFSNRQSGYTRIIKIASRKSDSARLAIIEFVD